MSASVLARSYNNTPNTGLPLLLPSATGSRSRPLSVQKATTASSSSGALIRTVSNMKGERARAGGPSTQGMRISFATDTSFNEKDLRSRRSVRSNSSSLNLRIVQGSGSPSKVRVRIPKATTATGIRRTSASHDEYLNPRKAVEIARSYGIPKFFLRSNSQQILTDGRMRLFGDSIWKKERTSSEVDRQSIDSSDVVSRLMDSVNKAIATSQKSRGSIEGEEGGIQLEVISMKSGCDDNVEKPYRGENRTTAGNNSHVANSANVERDSETLNNSGITSSGTNVHNADHSQKPHTVDPGGVSLTGYLPKVTFKETDMLLKNSDNHNNSMSRANSSSTVTTTGVRLKQLAAPFRGVSDVTPSQDKAKQVEDKYHYVLPRFYPAVNGHRFRLHSEADKSTSSTVRNKKKSRQNRLVQTVRFSLDAAGKVGDNDPLGGVVVKRAPVQSVQRALDSHSCLQQMEKRKAKLRNAFELDLKEETNDETGDNENAACES